MEVASISPSHAGISGHAHVKKKRKKSTKKEENKLTRLALSLLGFGSVRERAGACGSVWNGNI